MDPKLLFWTGALANMVVIVALAAAAVRARRRGDIRRHRRGMLAAAALVGLFLLSYALKLVWLGREEIERWSVTDVWILRIHELCVLAMLFAGGTFSSVRRAGS